MASERKTMAIRRVILTYRDYEALPNDGRRYEIHDGELSVTPSPGTRHQAVLMRLSAILHAHVTQRGLGAVYPAPTDVILSEPTVVQPDILYVAADRMRLVSARGIEGSPTLVIEIISPSTVQIDRHTKLQLYARHGVPHYWIVDPDQRSIEAYRLVPEGYEPGARARGDETWSTEPFADLAVPLALIWA
jgi:Uma2 family endonuclease